MTQKKSLKDSLKDLRDIVAWFEKHEDIDVEEGIEKVRKGAELLKQAKKRLSELENEFTEIKKGLEEDERENT